MLAEKDNDVINLLQVIPIKNILDAVEAMKTSVKSNDSY